MRECSSSLRSRLLLTIAISLSVLFLLFQNCDTQTRHLALQPAPPLASISPITKALVVASTVKTYYDAAWLAHIPRDWLVYHYVTDGTDPTTLSVPVDKGNEAMVYLTYIIDHYDALPDVVFFRHAHYRAWHQSFDAIFEVHNIRPGHVVEKGYVTPRCITGCENVMPVSERAVDIAGIHLISRDTQLRTLLSEFLMDWEDIPETIAAPCCAQFAASRSAIRARSLDWWKRMRNWLVSTALSSYDSGRLLEWTWHIWFGEAAQL